MLHFKHYSHYSLIFRVVQVLSPLLARSALIYSINLFQTGQSQVSPLEEEVAQLKQELKKSEMDREELLAELREYRRIKVEARVSASEDCVCINVSPTIPFHC